MKLPLLTPKELTGLDRFEEDRDLFNHLTHDFERSLAFFEAAIGDEDWSRRHPDFVRQYIKWVTALYYADEIDQTVSGRLYRLFREYPLQIGPYLEKDLTVRVGEKSYRANSILAGQSSPYLRDQIRRTSEKGGREIYLPQVYSHFADFLFDSNQDLAGFSEDQLIEIARSAQALGMDDLGREAETVAVRYIIEENALGLILKCHKWGLTHLMKLICEFYNGLGRGFSLDAQGKDLTVIFHDLKVLTTFELYKKLVPITTGIGFRGRLGSDPEIGAFIRLNPKIKTLDLSQTTVAIPFDDIPPAIHALLLNRAEWLTADSLEDLSKRFPNIRRLELEDVNYLTYVAYASISHFKAVEELNLKGVRLTDAELNLILSGMPGVRSLNVSGMKRIGPSTFENLFKNLDLTYVDLSHTNANDAVVADLVNRQRRLEAINLKGSAVTERFLEELARKTRVKLVYK